MNIRRITRYMHPLLAVRWIRDRTGLYLLNASQKLAYLCVPKNASTTMRRVLRNWRVARSTHPVQRMLLRKANKCAIVRDPWRRFVSTYNEVDQRVRLGRPVLRFVRSLAFAKVRDQDARFAQFVRDVGSVGVFDNHLVPQSCHVLATCVGVDEWMTHEKLKTDLLAYQKRHGLSGTIPHTKRNPHVERNERQRRMLQNDQKLTKVIRRVYADDFVLYKEKTHA